MNIAVPSCDPVPRSLGNEGCGQGLSYQGKTYHYVVGKMIPKDRVVALKWEGHYMGRIHGEVEHIIVAFDGTNFVVVETVFPLGVRESLRTYKGKTCSEAIQMMLDRQENQRRIEASRPKCQCGHSVLIFEDDQPPDMCFHCYNRQRMAV